MPNETPALPRLAFVVDADYGALGTMMYLLHGEPLAARSTLLMPRRIHDLHGATLGVASRPYQSLADILAAIDAERPDVVLLASGYLYAFQKLLTVREVQELVGSLAARGIRVATTDPYLGTWRKIPAAVAESDRGGLGSWVRRMQFERHTRRIASAVEPMPQFYPVPMPAVAGARRFSFFNPRYIRSATELRDISDRVSALPGMRAGIPRWLFVLASFDLQLQEKRYGTQGFADRVAARLRDAVDAGRHPTFIGPPAFVEALRPRFAGDARASLMSGCAFGEFELRLLDAEAAFYWQLFSTTAFLRLWNGLAVYFFDEGHNARLLKPLRAAGLAHYFMGDAPQHLDLDAALDASRISAGMPAFRERGAATVRRLSTLPQPAQMVEAIRRA